MTAKFKPEEMLGCLSLCIIAILVLVVGPAIAYGTDDEVVFTVTKSERVTTGSGDSVSSKYLVFTPDETFRNSDSLWYWKWDSSDLYGSLENGKTYRAKVYGFRVPFLSMYRNIVNVAEIGT